MSYPLNIYNKLHAKYSTGLNTGRDDVEAPWGTLSPLGIIHIKRISPDVLTAMCEDLQMVPVWPSTMRGRLKLTTAHGADIALEDLERAVGQEHWLRELVPGGMLMRSGVWMVDLMGKCMLSECTYYSIHTAGNLRQTWRRGVEPASSVTKQAYIPVLKPRSASFSEQAKKLRDVVTVAIAKAHMNKTTYMSTIPTRSTANWDSCVWMLAEDVHRYFRKQEQEGWTRGARERIIDPRVMQMELSDVTVAAIMRDLGRREDAQWDKAIMGAARLALEDVEFYRGLRVSGLVYTDETGKEWIC